MASLQLGAFTVKQALTDGWTQSALDYWVHRGELARLRRGVFASAQELAGTGAEAERRRFAANSAAAVLCESASVASHRSAAVLAGHPLLDVPDRPCLIIEPGRHGQVRGVHVHRVALDGTHDVIRDRPIHRTSSARTVIDVACESGVEQGLVIADAALYKSMTTCDALARCVSAARGLKGWRRAEEVVARCDGLSESVLESVSRIRLIDAGLPVPRLQARITVDGTEIARGDFLWEEPGVVGEADGLGKYDGGEPLTLRWEKQRQERLERAGLVVVRWGWADLMSETAFATLIDRLRWAFGHADRLHAGQRRWSVAGYGRVDGWAW